MPDSQRLDWALAEHDTRPEARGAGDSSATIRASLTLRWWFQPKGTSWITRDDVSATSEEMIIELASCLQRRIVALGRLLQ